MCVSQVNVRLLVENSRDTVNHLVSLVTQQARAQAVLRSINETINSYGRPLRSAACVRTGLVRARANHTLGHEGVASGRGVGHRRLRSQATDLAAASKPVMENCDGALAWYDLLARTRVSPFFDATQRPLAECPLPRSPEPEYNAAQLREQVFQYLGRYSDNVPKFVRTAREGPLEVSSPPDLEHLPQLIT